MSSRFIGWSETYSVTVTPSTPDPVIVADFSLGPEDDTIWIHAVTTPAPGDRCPFPWAYALLTWVTSEGRELGTEKIHGPCEGEVFRLGLGRTPLVRSGSIRLYPRSYNLKWVELGHPWTLSFRFSSGKSSEGFPVLGTRATLGVLADLVGAGVSYAITGDFATIRLSPK